MFFGERERANREFLQQQRSQQRAAYKTLNDKGFENLSHYERELFLALGDELGVYWSYDPSKQQTLRETHRKLTREEDEAADAIRDEQRRVYEETHAEERRVYQQSRQDLIDAGEYIDEYKYCGDGKWVWDPPDDGS